MISADILVQPFCVRSPDVGGVKASGTSRTTEIRSLVQAPQELGLRGMLFVPADPVGRTTLAACREIATSSAERIWGYLDARADSREFSTERLALSWADAGAELVIIKHATTGEIRVMADALTDRGFPTGLIVPATRAHSQFMRVSDRPFGSDVQLGNERIPPATLSSLEYAGARGFVVTPALHRLDVIHEIRRETRATLVAREGEAERLIRCSAGNEEWALTAMRRAGADLIVTEDALAVARTIQARERGMSRRGVTPLQAT